MNTDPGFRIDDVIGVLKRRLVLAGGVALAIFLLAILAAAVLPETYEAWTTLLIEPQRISEAVVQGDEEETDISARLHLMKMQILSRARLSKLIDELGLYPEESKRMTREEVIELMRSNIFLDPVLPILDAGERRRNQPVEINTFRLVYRSRSPQKAAAVANRLASDFIDEHIKERVQVSVDTTEFIEAQLESIAARSREVEAEIAAIEAENAGKLPEDYEHNQRMLARTLDNIRMVQMQLAEARSDEAFYRQQRATAAALGPASGRRLLNTPEARLLEVRHLLGNLRARGLTDKHPDVAAALREIEDLEQRIRERGGDPEIPPDTSYANAAEQEAEANRRRAALRAAAAEAELRRLEQLAQDIEQRLAETPRVAEQLDGLKRELEGLARNYEELSRRRLEATVAANMERRQKGQQFRILESAFVPPSPVSPNRRLILVLGLLFGLAAGAGAALLTEAMDTSFHDARSLQQALQIPVLTSIPPILFEADRRAMRRRRVALAASTALFVSLWIAGSVAGYVVLHVLGREDEEVETTAPAEQGALEWIRDGLA